jgi:hypothetical protein
MKKRLSWRVSLALFLLGLSALLHYIHFLIFRDAHHIFLYLLGDIAFVPISLLLVTLIFEHILEAKQKEATAHKLNMVLGVFFNEVGNPLVKHFLPLETDNPTILEHLRVKADWPLKTFVQARKLLKDFNYKVDAARLDLLALRDFLTQKRTFLMLLLENPNLLEHEQITDMLWAIFHLTEELIARRDLRHLGARDLEHLSGDSKRAFVQLILEWIEYMKHLKVDYPYLYSLAVRINPFDPGAAAEVV